MSNNCIFGPVPSRRFGRSLGIDVVPLKVCSLSCVYCQLGPTPGPTVERGAYVTLERVKRDLPPAIERSGGFDVATFSGSGEPTLNSGLGRIIRYAKSATDRPVVVLTNGTLLWRPDVRDELSAADIVAPSLDAGDEETFRRVNRPAEGLAFDRVVEGLVEFSEGFGGEVRLEVFLVAGVNDSDESVGRIAGIAGRIGPARVELNTAERRPAERWVEPVTRERLVELARLFTPAAEVIVKSARAEGPTRHFRKLEPAEVLGYLARRPAGPAELSKALGAEIEAVEELCERLLSAGEISLQKSPTGTVYAAREGGPE